MFLQHIPYGLWDVQPHYKSNLIKCVFKMWSKVDKHKTLHTLFTPVLRIDINTRYNQSLTFLALGLKNVSNFIANVLICAPKKIQNRTGK